MKCLVAIVDPERDRAVIDLAVALAAGEELILVSAIEVPEGDTLASVQPEARRLRRTLDQLVPANARARTLVTVARQGWQAIQETVANEHPDLLLLSWRRPGWDLLGTTIEDVLRNPPCDIAVVKGPLSRARRMLVPVRGGRYADLAAKVAIGWARARGGGVTLLHVRTPGRRMPTLYQLLGERTLDDRVDRLITRTGDPADVINEELAEHDAIVFGATGRKDQEDPLGPVGQAIVANARAAVIVRTATPVSAELTIPLPTLPADRADRSRVIGELVDKWFVQNTFSSTEFADLRRLVEAKERQGLTI